MVYTIPKDDFRYADDYENVLNLAAGAIRSRVDIIGTTEVYVDEDNICVEILKEQDAEKCREIIEHNADLYFIHQYGTNGDMNFENNYETWKLTKDIEELINDGSVGITRDDISQAEVRSVQDAAEEEEYVISLCMTDEGTTKFEEMTRKAFDNNARIAIWYEGKILCAPIVKTVLTNGQAAITGFRSYEEAEDIARSIRIGNMPYEIQQISCEVYERKIGINK